MSNIPHYTLEQALLLAEYPEKIIVNDIEITLGHRDSHLSLEQYCEDNDIALEEGLRFGAPFEVFAEARIPGYSEKIGEGGAYEEFADDRDYHLKTGASGNIRFAIEGALEEAQMNISKDVDLARQFANSRDFNNFPKEVKSMNSIPSYTLEQAKSLKTYPMNFQVEGLNFSISFEEGDFDSEFDQYTFHTEIKAYVTGDTNALGESFLGGSFGDPEEVIAGGLNGYLPQMIEEAYQEAQGNLLRRKQELDSLSDAMGLLIDRQASRKPEPSAP